MTDDFILAFFDHVSNPPKASQQDLAAKEKENMRFTDTYKIFKVDESNGIKEN